LRKLKKYCGDGRGGKNFMYGAFIRRIFNKENRYYGRWLIANAVLHGKTIAPGKQLEVETRNPRRSRLWQWNAGAAFISWITFL